MFEALASVSIKDLYSLLFSCCRLRACFIRSCRIFFISSFFSRSRFLYSFCLAMHGVINIEPKSAPFEKQRQSHCQVYKGARLFEGNASGAIALGRGTPNGDKGQHHSVLFGPVVKLDAVRTRFVRQVRCNAGLQMIDVVINCMSAQANGGYRLEKTLMGRSIPPVPSSTSVDGPRCSAFTGKLLWVLHIVL